MLSRKLMTVHLFLILMAAWALPVLAREVLKGKIEALNRKAKKITINGTEYTLGEESLYADIDVRGMVEALIEAGVEKDLATLKIFKEIQSKG